jgi:hypothetical protein
MIWGIAGCGPDDDAQVACRCTAETDVRAFPECIDVIVAESNDASSPFSSRIADCPSGSRLFLREPTTPEAVLFNIKDTMRGLSPAQYMDQLTEDFVFVPDVEAMELYLDVYNPPAGYNPEADLDTLWNREQERRFSVNLLDNTHFRGLDFNRWYESANDERKVGDDPLEERYIFPYAIEFTEQPTAGGEVFEVRGRLEVDVITETDDNPLWLVRRIRDFRDFATARRSLTEIRGDFAQ